MVRALALALTVLTGFSGLVYEVAWQKYLAALLGSHSEATAAVLAIFLGALAAEIADELFRRYYNHGSPFSEDAADRVRTACENAETCGR